MNNHKYAGQVLSYSKWWNNSMYIYEFSAVIKIDGEYKSVGIGSEMGGSDDCVCSEDACIQLVALTPPSLIAEYKTHLAAIAAERDAKAQAAVIASNKACAERAQITLEQLNRLSGALRHDDLIAVMTLLTTKKFRSSFRESLAKQVRSWLSMPNSTYRTPLSPKQMSYIG